MPFQARTIARSTAAHDVEGHGVVLGGLGIACAILLWMATGGSLPFDFGPQYDVSGVQIEAVTAEPDQRLADAAQPSDFVIQ